MRIGLLTLNLYLPGCRSLKEKRRRLKPLLHRLRKEFNLAVAEVDAQDAWQTAVIACATVSNDGAHVQQMLQRVVEWIEQYCPDVTVTGEEITLC